MENENLRASDAERNEVVDRLRSALAEGRLDLAEFDGRVQRVYAARTHGELSPILSDLPKVRNAGSAPVWRSRRVPLRVLIMWTPWVSVNILCLSIWLATGGGYFWPFWVAVPWGLALCIPTVIGITVGNRQGKLPRRDNPRS